MKKADFRWFYLLTENIHWLYFLAGVVLVSTRISFIETFVSFFGGFYVIGYVVVGFMFIAVVKITGYIAGITGKGDDNNINT